MQHASGDEEVVLGRSGAASRRQDPLGSRLSVSSDARRHSNPATSPARPRRPAALSSKRDAPPVNWEAGTVVALGLPVEATTLVEFVATWNGAVDRTGRMTEEVEVLVTVVVLLVEDACWAALTADEDAWAAEELEMMAAHVLGSRPLGQQLPLVKQKEPLGQAHELLQQVWPMDGL